MAYLVINLIYNNGYNLRSSMMNLQDMMMKLAGYSVGCRIMDGYFLINITYDETWNVIPPENDKIEFAQKNGVTYYMALINEVTFDEVFKSIKETIDYNIDLQKKVTLFKAKVDELQEIFAKEDLETLRTITFEYGKKKEKRKYVKKKDKTDKEEINIQGTTEETTKQKETKALVAEPKEKADPYERKLEEDTKANTNDYDDVVYEEYKGEETTETENKVDYLEQLKG